MKTRIGDKATLISILRDLGYKPDGGKKHEKWTNGTISVFVPRGNSERFSRMLAERILKRIGYLKKETT